MFDEVLDELMLTAYRIYSENKDKIEMEDEEFSKSKERKKLNKFYEAIAVLYSNKNGRP